MSDLATLSYLISFGVSSSSYFCISFLQNTNQMMRMMRRTPNETPTTAPAITPIPLTSARQTADVQSQLWARLLSWLLDSSVFGGKGISPTYSASWPRLCSFLPPHRCWLCICRLQHCPWSNSSVSQSLGFSDLKTAADENQPHVVSLIIFAIPCVLVWTHQSEPAEAVCQHICPCPAPSPICSGWDQSHQQTCTSSSHHPPPTTFPPSSTEVLKALL